MSTAEGIFKTCMLRHVLLTSGLPYIIGFPGVTYYEFDLSGEFVAGTTAATKPVQLEKQTVTFASPEGTTIYV